MQNLKCQIDNRENKLKPLISGFSPEYVALDLGDIVYKNGDDLLLIIERKSISDLAASICDGRYHEQKARLLNCGISVNRVMYIVEGNLGFKSDAKIGGVNYDIILGSIVGTMLRDGIKVWHTQDITETASFIEKLYKKIAKDGGEYWCVDKGAITPGEYSGALAPQKKKNLTPEVCFRKQLSLIPGIGATVADCVAEKYKTLCNLILAYEALPEIQRKNMLKGTGKIGPVLSARIYHYIYGIDDTL